MGVQLANSTKASQELSPEVRTLLRSAVQRDEILTMLKGKAEKSLMDVLSTQTTSLLESSDKLNSRMSALSEQQTRAISVLALESEQSDALLDSRLSHLEAIQNSLYPQAKGSPASQTQNLQEQCDSMPISQDNTAEKAPTLPYINDGVDSVQKMKTAAPSSSLPNTSRHSTALQESDSTIPSSSFEMLPKKKRTLKGGPLAPRAPLVSFLQPQSSP